MRQNLYLACHVCLERCLTLDRSQSTQLRASLLVSAENTLGACEHLSIPALQRPQARYFMALNSAVCTALLQSACSWTTFSSSPSASSFIIIKVGCLPESLEGVALHSEVRSVFTWIKEAALWKDLRGHYLDQGVLDDSAHIQSPFCNIRVVLVQVWWKGQQMRSEIVCREWEIYECILTCWKDEESSSLAPASIKTALLLSRFDQVKMCRSQEHTVFCIWGYTSCFLFYSRKLSIYSQYEEGDRHND